MDADITVFDAEPVIDQATFVSPNQRSKRRAISRRR